MLSTCRVLVKNLKGPDLISNISETARLEYILIKREMATKKVMGLFVGVPWLEIIMKHSACIQVRFGSWQLDLVWVRGQLIRPVRRTTNSDITSRT